MTDRKPLIIGKHPKADVAGVPYDSNEWARAEREATDVADAPEVPRLRGH